jgi:ubiquinone/menaquinone biosynthesis C-methylase UbiE
VLCSVDDLDRAVGEARRVLKPGGRLLFVEHVASTSPKTARWQRRLDPVWHRMMGGCHLTRDPVAALARAGFTEITVEEIDLGRNPSPSKPVIRGSARA